MSSEAAHVCAGYSANNSTSISELTEKTELRISTAEGYGLDESWQTSEHSQAITLPPAKQRSVAGSREHLVSLSRDEKKEDQDGSCKTGSSKVGLVLKTAAICLAYFCTVNYLYFVIHAWTTPLAHYAHRLRCAKEANLLLNLFLISR